MPPDLTDPASAHDCDPTCGACISGVNPWHRHDIPSGPRLGEEWRPWCCPEPRCTPVHTLSGSEQPLSQAEPGETFLCFGAAPVVEFTYDGVKHVNDTRSCTYTPLKGVISYQENADDWRAISGAYSRATAALLQLRNGDEGVRNV